MSPSPPSFTLQLAATRKPRPKDSELVFGRTFTDHMAVADWESERGWFDPRVVPYGPFSLDPAAAVFHYAQEMFDGLKAFRGADGKIRFFRLDRHCKRMHDGGERLCIPAIDEALMREAILSLVRADADWVPSSAGHVALHPSDHHRDRAVPGRAPGEAVRVLRDRVAGRRLRREVFSPARILVEDKYVRAAAGGLGGVKAGANYIASLRAAEDAKARGYAQVLWTDAVEHTYLEEVGTMNLVVRIGDEFVTPPLGGSILVGRDARFGAHAAARLGLCRARAADRDGGADRRPPRGQAARGVRLRHRRGHHAGGRARLEGRGHGDQRRRAGRDRRRGCSTRSRACSRDASPTSTAG